MHWRSGDCNSVFSLRVTVVYAACVRAVGFGIQFFSYASWSRLYAACIRAGGKIGGFGNVQRPPEATIIHSCWEAGGGRNFAWGPSIRLEKQLMTCLVPKVYCMD